jgi:hypothetical protein
LASVWVAREDVGTEKGCEKHEISKHWSKRESPTSHRVIQHIIRPLSLLIAQLHQEILAQAHKQTPSDSPRLEWATHQPLSRRDNERQRQVRYPKVVINQPGAGKSRASGTVQQSSKRSERTKTACQWCFSLEAQLRKDPKQRRASPILREKRFRREDNRRHGIHHARTILSDRHADSRSKSV